MEILEMYEKLDNKVKDNLEALSVCHDIDKCSKINGWKLDDNELSDLTDIVLDAHREDEQSLDISTIANFVTCAYCNGDISIDELRDNPYAIAAAVDDNKDRDFEELSNSDFKKSLFPNEYSVEL